MTAPLVFKPDSSDARQAPIDLRTGSGVRVTATSYHPGTALARHHHAAASLSLVVDGSYDEEIGARRFGCAPFTAVYKATDVEHANYVGGSGFRGIFVEATPALHHALGDTLGRIPEVRALRTARTQALIVRMAAEIRDRQAGYELVVESCALELWATLVREGESPKAAAPAWLRRARDYLDAQATQPIGLAQVATEAGVHPAHLAQSFRRHFGCSVGEYIRARRLDLAERLLSTTTRSVGEIAIEAGFADHSHLTRAFRARTGATPTAFRGRRAG